MRIGYKRSLTFIAILIIVAGIIGISYLFYDKVLSDDTIVMVDNELSINYMNGNKISTNGTFNFSITNNGQNDVYYDIYFDDIKGHTENVIYSLSSIDTFLNITEQLIDSDNPTILNSALIKAGATQNYTLTIDKNSDLTFTVVVKKTSDTIEYFYATILKNNAVQETPKTLVGTDIATVSEGLIKDVDNNGITYYFRGVVNNNYVSFADKLWRIVRINGDGTVRLVLDGVSEDLTSYHTDASGYEDYQNTTIVSSLNSFYNLYLNSYDEVIASTKVCYENGKTENKNEFIYNSYIRVATNVIPTFNCLGDSLNSKIGLLTVDEVMYAGGNLASDNTDYYLYNSSIETYYFISNIAKATTSAFYPFMVSDKGKIVTSVNGSLNRGLRPVINLNKKVMVTGDGTTDNPYKPE